MIRRQLRIKSKLRKKLKSMRLGVYCSLAILFPITSCTSIPDIPACVSISSDSGWCTTVISHKEFIVDSTHPLNKKNWQEVDDSSVKLPFESWVELHTYFDNNCHKSKDCASGTGTWGETAESIDSRVRKKKK